MKYLCKKKFNKVVVFCFDKKPTYDNLLDYWDREGGRILSYDEAKPYLTTVWFENSPYEIND